MEDAFWEKLYYVQDGKNREDTLTLLERKEVPLTPTEIGNAIDISMNAASRAVRQLADRDLVVCVNPDSHRNRGYRITEEGRKVVQELREKEASL